MTNRFTEPQLISLLEDIRAGRVAITSPQQPSEVFAGNVTYFTSNGFEIVVFNDCNEWDYLDSIRKGGKRVDYSDIQKFYPKVAKFSPSDDNESWEVWGIPGYMKDAPHKWDGWGLR